MKVARSCSSASKHPLWCMELHAPFHATRRCRPVWRCRTLLHIEHASHMFGFALLGFSASQMPLRGPVLLCSCRCPCSHRVAHPWLPMQHGPRGRLCSPRDPSRKNESTKMTQVIEVFVCASIAPIDTSCVELGLIYGGDGLRSPDQKGGGECVGPDCGKALAAEVNAKDLGKVLEHEKRDTPDKNTVNKCSEHNRRENQRKAQLAKCVQGTQACPDGRGAVHLVRAGYDMALTEDIICEKAKQLGAQLSVPLAILQAGYTTSRSVMASSPMCCTGSRLCKPAGH